MFVSQAIVMCGSTNHCNLESSRDKKTLVSKVLQLVRNSSVLVYKMARCCAVISGVGSSGEPISGTLILHQVFESFSMSYLGPFMFYDLFLCRLKKKLPLALMELSRVLLRYL